MKLYCIYCSFLVGISKLNRFVVRRANTITMYLHLFNLVHSIVNDSYKTVFSVLTNLHVSLTAIFPSKIWYKNGYRTFQRREILHSNVNIIFAWNRQRYKKGSASFSLEWNEMKLYRFQSSKKYRKHTNLHHMWAVGTDEKTNCKGTLKNQQDFIYMQDDLSSFSAHLFADCPAEFDT